MHTLQVAWSAFMSHMASKAPAPAATSAAGAAAVPTRVLVGDGVVELVPAPSGPDGYLLQPGSGKRRL